jgi:TonB-linked SusC/RagA family outer membrane protein
MEKFSLTVRRLLLLAFLLLTLVFSSFSQAGFSVNGKISDANGLPVEGVTVQEKGTQNFTLTKKDGTFSLRTQSGSATLLLSSVGYVAQEIPVNNQANVAVTMQATANSLNEVVVVGYGTQRKSDVTGSLSRITADVIQERPAQNVLQALQGKAAGVQVSSNLKPGELPVVRVRGNRSLGASNDPLYVIDGIPMVNALGVNSFSMADLNPNDIATMEILKDASATAIYGSRGANGVVLITTKRGKAGRVSVNYLATVSLDKYHAMTDWMNGGEYIDRWRLSAINGRTYHSLTDNGDFYKPAKAWFPNPKDDSTLFGTGDAAAIAAIMQGYEWNPDGSVRMRQATTAEKAMGWPDMVPIYNSANIPTYDWINDATRQGVTNNHQLSVSAGNAVSRMSLSLGYFNQLGVQRDQDYNRFNVNLNGDITATKWLTLGTSVIASLAKQNYGIFPPNTSNTGSKDLYSRAIDQFPYASPKDAQGGWIKNAGGNLNLWNPLIDIDQVLNERRTTAIMSNTFAEVKFTSWLKYRLNFGAQYRKFRNGSWTGPNATNHLTNRPNTAGQSTDDNFSWVAENLLFVDKSFGPNHKLGVTLLQSAQKSRRESLSVGVSGTTIPLSLWYDLASNTQGNPSYGSGFTENTLYSYMGRVNYTLMNRYLITASGRFDGASVLAPGHKWDFFPSFAVAWKAQDEEFLRNVAWLNELKPRVGWGVTGNSSVNPYTTTGPLSRNPYVYGGAPAIGYLPQLVQNPDLGWEKTAQINVGLDVGLFSNRISGSIEWYRQTTTDLILPRSLPPVSGYVQKFENIGKTRNSGVEITLSTVNIRNANFSWSTDINWSQNKEEILELQNGAQDMLADRRFIGHPLAVFYNYANAGVWGASSKELEEMAKFNANGHRFYPGTIRVVDQDGDYRINANDMIILGSPRPLWTGGITNNITYKNWTFNSFIYFRWGQMYFGGYPNSYGGVNPNGRVENNIWSWENQNGRWPMANFGNVENNVPAMQYNDGSFGVVRNLSLSYSFPKKWISRITASELVLNFQVLNPIMFGPGVVKWGINPDDDTNWGIASSNGSPLGGTNNNTILPRSFVIGVRAGF